MLTARGESRFIMQANSRHDKHISTDDVSSTPPRNCDERDYDLKIRRVEWAGKHVPLVGDVSLAHETRRSLEV